MKENAQVIGIITTYAALLLLLLSQFSEGLREAVQPTAIGLTAVGVLTLFWHVVALARQQSVRSAQ